MEKLNGNRVSPVRLKNRSAASDTIPGAGPSPGSISILMRFHSCRAIPRQSNPGPRFVVDAGICTDTSITSRTAKLDHDEGRINTGVQEFRSSGVQEFRSSGVQEFNV